jgi:hypothetical protein
MLTKKAIIEVSTKFMIVLLEIVFDVFIFSLSSNHKSIECFDSEFQAPTTNASSFVRLKRNFNKDFSSLNGITCHHTVILNQLDGLIDTQLVYSLLNHKLFWFLVNLVENLRLLLDDNTYFLRLVFSFKFLLLITILIRWYLIFVNIVHTSENAEKKLKLKVIMLAKNKPRKKVIKIQTSLVFFSSIFFYNFSTIQNLLASS